MSTLGMACPFCGSKLQTEIYAMRKGFGPTMTIFCDNDTCEVKPSTIDTNPAAAFEDVKAWGSYPCSSKPR